MNVYGFVGNAPTISVDGLGAEITGLTLTPTFRHGTIESWSKRGRAGRQHREVIEARKEQNPTGAPHLRKWGYVDIAWGVDGNSKVWSQLHGWTDVSKAPFPNGSVGLSASVDGDVDVEGCCESGTVVVDWVVRAMRADRWVGVNGRVDDQRFVAVGVEAPLFRSRGFVLLDIGSGKATYEFTHNLTWTQDAGDSRYAGFTVLDMTVYCLETPGA